MRQGPQMTPIPGSRQIAHIGDRLRVTLRSEQVADGDRAWLRTTIGRGRQLRALARRPLVGSHPLPGSEWQDLPMRRDRDGFVLELVVSEPGPQQLIARLETADGVHHWPDGGNAQVNVHPAWTRFDNTIYCAFTRQFGQSRFESRTDDPVQDDLFGALERHGYAVLPPSGTLRDLARQLDHIVDRCGCRILQLLPINPTPTTYARMGRYGSPYAALDLTGIDPALVEFDRRTTAVDQFRELVDGVHRRGARLILDLAINHTGWGSWLQNEHPEFFKKNDDGSFASPGAWGTTWEDLVELEQSHQALWRHLAEAFLVWCRRGVDGFRCDAGYMIPVPVWTAIVATVHEEFPETVFLLEGLGGAWEATTDLLDLAGMQWAYSELFQNEGSENIATYTEHVLQQSEQHGRLVNFSETHDNLRLAARGRRWSLLRNRLCALTSPAGCFAFTAGVEWLCSDKLDVHRSRGLNWDAPDNIVADLRRLTGLLRHHPAFHEGATSRRLTEPESPVYALWRQAVDDGPAVLVVVNTRWEEAGEWTLPATVERLLGSDPVDLLGQAVRWQQPRSGGLLLLAAGQVLCLAPQRWQDWQYGDRRHGQIARDAAAWQAAGALLDPVALAELPAQPGDQFVADPRRFATAVSLRAEGLASDWAAAWELAAGRYQPVTVWQPVDVRRVVPLPTHHWLLIRSQQGFRLDLRLGDRRWQSSSTRINTEEILLLPPLRHGHGDACIALRRRDGIDLCGTIRLLDGVPRLTGSAAADGVVLLTNGRGGMAQVPVDLPQPRSKYHGLLAANLHPTVPANRHIFIHALRAYALIAGVSHPLDAASLISCTGGDGTVGEWHFSIPYGDGSSGVVACRMGMRRGRNSTLLRWWLAEPPPAGIDLRLICRFDIEDRDFHTETQRSPAADAHFSQHLRFVDDGFSFTPAADRRLVVRSDRARFHPEPEWREAIPHVIEAERGLTASSDAFSPGWFGASLDDSAPICFVCDAETEPLAAAAAADLPPATVADDLGAQLRAACQAYVVQREDWSSVIAGYPWFLDWGRDTLICARGLLTAGYTNEVVQMLRVFGRFAEDGTLPNCIYGEDATNRNTSDAPLWYAVVVEEAAAILGEALYRQPIDDGRTIDDVLLTIATGYRHGSANGIAMDPQTGLVYSPSHFTWMDTNHPPGTPREGYPIEIQALWWRLLRQLHDRRPDEDWGRLAEQVHLLLNTRYWSADRGWLADNLRGLAGTGAAEAQIDDALRSNALIAIALGAVHGQAARQTVVAAADALLVPGAIRSLAPGPVKLPCPVHDAEGGLLNDPFRPYRGRYTGDEDTRRKPAYHNGTAWVWPFPSWCEAALTCFDESDPVLRRTVRALLAGVDRLLTDGCHGQLPEICDGDAPHRQRGCDAQAWSVTEVLRLWQRLHLEPVE